MLFILFIDVLTYLILFTYHSYCSYYVVFAILYPPNSGKLLPNRKHPQAASAKKGDGAGAGIEDTGTNEQSKLKRVTSKETWTPQRWEFNL